MKTATIVLIVAAFGWLLAEVWYGGFSEGWRQASVALAAESTAQKEQAGCPAPLQTWRIPDNHSVRL